MVSRAVSRRPVVLMTALILAILVAACGGVAAVPPSNPTNPPATATGTPDPTGTATTTTRTVTDMAGREVTIPAKIESVVTLGSVPPLNSLVFVLGESGAIVNGLPDEYLRSPRWKYQTTFAPQLATQPVMQAPDRSPQLEELLAADPDVVLTTYQTNIEPLESRGIPVIFIAWQDPDDVKAAVTLLGEVFNKQDVAADYIDYFDRTIARVEEVTREIPESERPRVIYMNLKDMTQPHLIAEWWITTAGGNSVTNDGRTSESLGFSAEQLIAWDPEIMIISSKDDVGTVYDDSRFATIAAVQNERVMLAPIGSHNWANRTIENPLTVLWAAKTFYPDRFADIDLVQEVRDFYSHFFHHEITVEQAEEILSGDLQ